MVSPFIFFPDKDHYIVKAIMSRMIRGHGTYTLVRGNPISIKVSTSDDIFKRFSQTRWLNEIRPPFWSLEKDVAPKLVPTSLPHARTKSEGCPVTTRFRSNINNYHYIPNWLRIMIVMDSMHHCSGLPLGKAVVYSDLQIQNNRGTWMSSCVCRLELSETSEEIQRVCDKCPVFWTCKLVGAFLTRTTARKAKLRRGGRFMADAARILMRRLQKPARLKNGTCTEGNGDHVSYRWHRWAVGRRTTDASVERRSCIGRASVNPRPMSVDARPTLDQCRSSVGGVSVVRRPSVGRQSTDQSADCQPTLKLLFVKH